MATKECDASEAYKEAYINATEEDVNIIQSPVGMPGRALHNKFIKNMEKARLPISKCYNCLEKCNPQKVPYCITRALIDAVRTGILRGKRGKDSRNDNGTSADERFDPVVRINFLCTMI